MSGFFRRLGRAVRLIANWYATPTGLLSAAALLAVLALSLCGAEWIATWVLVAWLGTLLPYKLDRERADRKRRVAGLSTRLDRLNRSVKKARAEVAVARSELAVTPTVEELAEWQEILDQRTAATEAKTTGLGPIAESLRKQRKETQTLRDEFSAELASVRAEIQRLSAE